MKITSFKYAWRGLQHMLQTEVNARIHMVFVVLVVAAGFIFGISALEWIAIVLCIGAVLAAEAFNTAIERVCNKVSPEQNPLIGQAKDVAAGAVLVLAITSVVVGIIIFLPYFVNYFNTLTE